MKRLDHNEAVKALREGKVVWAHLKEGFSLLFRASLDGLIYSKLTETSSWAPSDGHRIIFADYFTLEEPEELKCGLPDRIIAWTGNMDLGPGQWPRNQRHHMVELLQILFEELDKRYVRK